MEVVGGKNSTVNIVLVVRCYQIKNKLMDLCQKPKVAQFWFMPVSDTPFVTE